MSFCASFIERGGSSWPPTEDALAREFVSFCGIAALVQFDALSELCVRLGITVSVQPMPSELRGHNSSYNGARTIAIAEQHSFPGAKEHTLLHEVRELLEHTFVHLGFGIAINPEDMEQRAEHFACFVRSTLAGQTMIEWLEHAEQVEKKWVRYGVYLICVVGGLAMFMGCILLPRFEDQALQSRQQRSLEKQQSNPSAA